MITAPYNFVPLSRFVYFPDWADQVSHDVPFSDAISGTLVCKLTAMTPIYVRNGGNWEHNDILNNPEAQAFFRMGSTATGYTYMIPGASIKGMLRNVLEIISFGKMDRNRVEDPPYSIRDLNYQIYRDKMTDRIGRDRDVFESKVNAGWLTQDAHEDWHLTPCEYARVDQIDLIAYHGHRPDIKAKQSAEDKYNKWGPNRTVQFDYSENSWCHSCGKIQYKKASDLGVGSRATGEIVFTGQPSANETVVSLASSPARVTFPEKFKYDNRRNQLKCAGLMLDNEKTALLALSSNTAYQTAVNELYIKSATENARRVKHMEFIFFAAGPPDQSIKISDKLKDEFLFIHRDSLKDSEDWNYWQEKLNLGERIPVFYLGTASNPDSMGLAQMYRLPYKHSILDTICHTDKDHSLHDPDLADVMFGYIDEKGKDSLKGRISISHAVAAAGTVSQLSCQRKVLSSPRPTYYPNYIKQQTPVATYKTMMDGDAEVRGWKRYPTRKPENLYDTPDSESADKLVTKFIPLDSGVQFEFKIRFHNLRHVELGALIWTLKWGGDASLCHRLGMAKPFGYGQIKINIDDDASHFINAKRESITKTLNAYMNDFVTHMTSIQYVPNVPFDDWENCEQLSHLKAMANPDQEPAGTTQTGKLKYMELSEFRDAKQAPKKILEPHLDYTRRTDLQRFRQHGGQLGSKQKALIKRDIPIIEIKDASIKKDIIADFDKIKNLDDRQELFNFFENITEDDAAEFSMLDLSAVKNILNIGAVKNLQALEMNAAIKSIVACKMLTFIEPKKKWDSDKKERYEELKVMAKPVK
ncbi:MAG: TIGR03986 family CRISPR-associated RAMP protein [Deltaproteobacteria bacterium]|nr:TIGR03986 family CRISPR-associated RAMP protein [Deltaproteobacteria bacterium]